MAEDLLGGYESLNVAAARTSAPPAAHRLARLPTRANTGLGKETARQLVAAGHTVYVGARDEAHGHAAADELGARFVQLDVTADASVATAPAQIEADGSRPASHYPSIVYGSSNAAVSMLTVQRQRCPRSEVPGITATNLCGGDPGSHPGRPAEVSARIVLKLAMIGKDGPTGTFHEDDGELGW